MVRKFYVDAPDGKLEIVISAYLKTILSADAYALFLSELRRKPLSEAVLVAVQHDAVLMELVSELSFLIEKHTA
jgi:hypothetical protein